VRVVHLSTLHKPFDVRIFHKECRTLAASGYRVDYLVTAPPASEAQGIHFQPCRKPTDSFRLGRIWKRLLGVYRQAAALRGDVYHFHDPELIPVGMLLKRLGTRVVYDVHEDAPQEALSFNQDRPLEGCLKSWALIALEEAAKRTLDAFVCATPAIARKFPRQRTITVQNFPMLSEVAPAVDPSRSGSYHDRPRAIVYAGGITAIRGIREMIQAFESLASSQVRLNLAGEFAPAELKQEVETLPGWRQVDFLGWQSRQRVSEILARSRAGLVLFHPRPEHLDSQPNKLFEYMAAGLPVIASDFPLWKAIIERTGCGLTVDPLRPPAIAAAIRHLLAHPREAFAMGQRGQRAVQAEYNWEPEGRKLLELYRKLEKADRTAPS
jgi:glycosyltransferase involved in cell wall biosynthesis